MSLYTAGGPVGEFSRISREGVRAFLTPVSRPRHGPSRGVVRSSGTLQVQTVNQLIEVYEPRTFWWTIHPDTASIEPGANFPPIWWVASARASLLPVARVRHKRPNNTYHTTRPRQS